MFSHNLRPGSWIVTLPLAAGSMAYLLLFFLPGQRAAEELRSQIGEKREHVTHSHAVGATLVAAEAELRLAEQYQEQWRSAAPNVAHLSELYAAIDRVEKESGVQPTRFDPQPVVCRESFSEVPLMMGYVGPFANVFRLLYGLECLPAEVWVRRIHIAKMDDHSEYVQCRLELAVFADNRKKTDYVKNSN